MTTLIRASNSDGEYGRCDAKCYNAHGPDCDCICGGRNHGKGLAAAQAATTEFAQAMVDEYSARHSLGSDVQFTSDYAAGVLPGDFQPNLFSLIGEALADGKEETGVSAS